MRWICLAVVLTVQAPGLVRALEPPPEDVREARRLAKEAKRVARKGEWGEATRMLGKAEELHPSFDYAFQLAVGHRDNGLLVLSWRALRRAEGYGVPSRQQKHFDRMRAEVETDLLVGHAFIELTDVPENADVRINGRQWLPPYFMWLDRHFSTVVVEHPDFLKTEFNWHHMKGQKHTRPVTMQDRRMFGRLRITGSPDGASVRVDGTEVGKLPSVQTEWLAPGSYTVKVQAGREWLAFQQKADVKAGKVTDVTVVLEPSQSDTAKLLASKRFWGWTFAGTGGALTITGAALLGVAASAQSDVEALNANHPADVGNYSDYSAEYDDRSSGISGMATGGHVLLWIGLAMAGTGTALLLLDRGDDAAFGPSGHGGEAVRVLGEALTSGWRF